MTLTPNSRYHPALVALQWLLAALIGFSLVMGFFVLAPMGNSAPDKLVALRAHMIVGFAILALMVVRFAVRFGTPRPAPLAFRPRAAHGVLARLLVVLVALHVAAAAFHQLVLRDRLLSRMGIAKP